MVHRPEQAEGLPALGAMEVLAGDLRDAADVGRAMAGARAVYHICPNVHADEVTISQVAIDAAREAGVDLFVYHSVLHPQVEAMPHHWLKMRVEERIFQSGIDYVILQPAVYMQNVLAQWETVARDRVYAVPYGAGTRLGMVDLEDVAAVAARVLTEPGHAGATYELAGPQALTQAQVADALGRQLGLRVEARQVPLETWAQAARAAGLGEYQVETLLQMFRYYDRHGLWGNARVLGHLLAREPTHFEAFVARVAGALQGGADAV
jgi:uncharacterized protein YbjT (DUF2867 family)